MRILHVNYTDSYSGAATAAIRIHRSLKYHSSCIDTSILFGYKRFLGIEDGFHPNSTLQNIKSQVFGFLDYSISRLQRDTTNPLIHSPSFFSSINLNRLEKISPDIFHLHWIKELLYPFIACLNKSPDCMVIT